MAAITGFLRDKFCAPVEPWRLERFARWYLALLALQLLWDARAAFGKMASQDPFNPIPLFELFGFEQPPLPLFQGAYVLFIACVALGAWGKYVPRFLAFSAALLSFYVFGSLLSFQKAPGSPYVPHSMNLVFFVLVILAMAPRGKPQFNWPLSLIRLSLALVYFGSAYVKLREGGLAWMNGYTLQAYLFEHSLLLDTPRTEWIANQHGLCLFLSVLVIFFELTFVLAALTRRVSLVYAAGGIFMHISILFFMNINFFAYHALAYLVFLVGGFHKTENT